MCFSKLSERKRCGPFSVGVFGMDSLMARPRRKMFLVNFVVREMVMVTCSGSVLFSHFQHVRDLPEFAYLLSLDRSN